MRLIIQRVRNAQVDVNQLTVGQIEKGLLVLIGIEDSDTHEDVNYLVGKLINMRIFSDSEGKMNLSPH